MSDSDIDMTPPDIRARAAIANDCVIPEKSKNQYNAVYVKFIEWKTLHNAKTFSETVLMAYFQELSETYRPSTLWSKYSMLKAVIKLKHDIDIKTYTRLTAFLKRQSAGFQSKKSKVLTAEQIETFINEAPDQQHLATKV